MNFNEYQTLAMRTMSKTETVEDGYLVSALGLAGEAGEFVELVKKEIYHSKEIPLENYIKELGDILWYIARAATALNIPLEYIASCNIEKLQKRYPQGFSALDSAVRRDLLGEGTIEKPFVIKEGVHTCNESITGFVKDNNGPPVVGEWTLPAKNVNDAPESLGQSFIVDDLHTPCSQGVCEQDSKHESECSIWSGKQEM